MKIPPNILFVSLCLGIFVYLTSVCSHLWLSLACLLSISKSIWLPVEK